MEKEIKKVMRDSIKKGDLLTVKQILAGNKEWLNESTPFGSWLQVASAHGQYDIVKYLIACGIDINYVGGMSEDTALTQAAFRGNVDIIELLYDNGAVFDVSNANRNPLFAAIYNGHFNVVKYLVENGIDITASYPIGQLENVDAYEYARQYGQTEIANYLKTKLNEM